MAMYNEYFGFREAPFSIAPDPRYLFMTEQHREALAHLVYGVSSQGGCMLLTGEVGTGKTTVCRGLLEHVPENSNLALVFNPKVTAIELLETVCDELKIEYPDSGNTIKTYIDRLNKFLLEAHARGEKTVLIIDEAQNLDSTVLEQLRLLTNLETDQKKLLQIIILGQPELLDILSREDMRQLAQRITARFHLKALSRQEIKAYVSHRLAIAGQNAQLFPEETIKKLYQLSKGIPRLINILCDRALLGAYVQDETYVSSKTLDKASKEVFGELKTARSAKSNTVGWTRFAIPVTALASIAIITSIVLLNTMQAPENTVHKSEDTLPLIQQSANLGSIQKSEASDVTSINQPIENTASAEAVSISADPVDEFIQSSDDNNIGPAFATLLGIWNHQYSDQNPAYACTFAETKGLSCLHRQGNLRSLGQLNRPAILKLYNDNGDNAYAIITYLSTDKAILNTGKKELQLSTSTLDRHWLGEYTLLWQKPPFYDQALQQGSQGPIVQWLDQVLVRMYGQNSIPTINNTYTEELVAKVKKFQQSKGLVADGVAGPMTLIHLNNAIGVKAPLLKTRDS